MKTFLRKRLVVILVTGSALVLSVFLYFAISFNHRFLGLNSNESEQVFITTTASSSHQQEQVKIELPARLKIPNIHIDAAIEQKGLTPDGAMDVPDNRNDVAWFSLGTRPGEKGSAVIAGHSGYKVGKVIFDDLNQLVKGDKVYVEDASGKSFSFFVREIRMYDSDAYTPEVFVSDRGKHLNLITCAGIWDKSKKNYSKRLVVFTDSTE